MFFFVLEPPKRDLGTRSIKAVSESVECLTSNQYTHFSIIIYSMPVIKYACYKFMIFVEAKVFFISYETEDTEPRGILFIGIYSRTVQFVSNANHAEQFRVYQQLYGYKVLLITISNSKTGQAPVKNESQSKCFLKATGKMVKVRDED